MDLAWSSVALFLAAELLLDFFDVSMPRGDSVGVAGALCASSVVVLGFRAAGVVALGSALVAHVARRGVDSPRRLATVMLARGAGLLASAFVYSRVSPGSSTIVAMLVPAVFLAVELVVAQVVSAAATGRPLVRLLGGNLGSQAPLIAAQWSASVLLLLTYDGMRVWSLVPTVALLLLMRQSYSMFLDIRETYRTTVEVLVEAAESQDERRLGHADRTAVIARSIAMRVGLSAPEVERISFAALLHDLGELAADPSATETSGSRHACSADILSGVEFFDRIVPVLRVCDGCASGAAAEEDLLAALVVALASDIDAEYHPGVAAAHSQSILPRVAHRVSPATKARAVGAALRLGYRIPAVN
jgi:hypothetical protein